MVVTLIFLVFDCGCYIVVQFFVCVCVCSPMCSGGGVVDKYLPVEFCYLIVIFLWIAHVQRPDASCLFL